MSILPQVVQRLAAERPDVELELYEHDDPDELIAGLDRRSLDAAFLVDNLIEHDYPSATLLVDPYVAVVPAGTHEPGTPVAMSRISRYRFAMSAPLFNATVSPLVVRLR